MSPVRVAVATVKLDCRRELTGVGNNSPVLLRPGVAAA